MSKLKIATTTFLLFASPLLFSADQTRSGIRVRAKAKPAVARQSVGTAASTATVLSETLVTDSSTVTVFPGQSTDFESSLNFAGAEHLAVSVLTTGNSINPEASIFVNWAEPGQLFGATDVLTAAGSGNPSGFLFSDSGGAVTRVYGSNLLLHVVNNGSTPFTIVRLSLYAVIH